MADAHGSGPCVRKDVGVQLPPRPLAWSLQSQVGFTQVLARVAAGGPHNAGRRTGQVVSEPARAQQQLPRTRRRTRSDKTTREYVVGQAVQLAGSLLILVPFHGCSCSQRSSSRPPAWEPLTGIGPSVLAVPAAVRGRVFGLAQADIIVQAAAILRAGGAGQHVTPALVVASAGGLGTAAAVLLSGSLRRADRTLGGLGSSGPSRGLREGDGGPAAGRRHACAGRAPRRCSGRARPVGRRRDRLRLRAAQRGCRGGDGAAELPGGPLAATTRAAWKPPGRSAEPPAPRPADRPDRT